MNFHGWMLFNADGTPLNCVGSWRVFQTRKDADRYYHADWRRASKIKLRRVRVEVTLCK